MMSLAPFAVLLPLLVLYASPSCCHAASPRNITDILAVHPAFIDISAALSRTGVVVEIENRTTVTVLAVDNAAAAAATQTQRLQPEELKRAVSLHVLLDYLDDAKFSGIQGGFALYTTLYQASGNASEGDGIVNITTHRGGRVAFTAAAETTGAPPATALYLKPVQTAPYNILVLQVNALMISLPLTAVHAPAPAPGATPRSTDLLSKNGCRGFAVLINASDNAAAAYERAMAAGAGLTMFCPSDKAVAVFNHTFANLTADAQVSLLLYHGVAAHYTVESLKAINGAVSTLATDGSKSYNLTIRDDRDTVKLSSASATAASVTKTLMDKEAVAVYLTDTVLLPMEVFNSSHGGTAPSPVPDPAAPATAPAMPAPAPVSAASAIEPMPRRRPAPEPASASAPSLDADDKPPADQKNNSVRDMASWTLGATVVAAVIVLVL
jgi:uncharacterized surface protein with fasciclin (FAS1) repeats